MPVAAAVWRCRGSPAGRPRDGIGCSADGPPAYRLSRSERKGALRVCWQGGVLPLRLGRTTREGLRAHRMGFDVFVSDEGWSIIKYQVLRLARTLLSSFEGQFGGSNFHAETHGAHLIAE